MYNKYMRRVLRVVLLFSFLLLFVGNVSASIVLKLLVVNPSDEQVQVMPIKVYLPKEIKPDDVIDKGDLQIGYDTQQGSYYIYGEYRLEPSEVLEREIELRDIWIVPIKELQSLRAESEKVNNLLKNTEFADRISFLYNTIITKLDSIQERQKTTKSNPENHISQYRSHMKLIESVKVDLAVARSMLSKTKPFSSAAIWKVMIFVLVFLGILGVSFYFLWFRQVKLADSEDLPKKEELQVEGEVLKEDKTKEGGEEESGGDDIEKTIRGE